MKTYLIDRLFNGKIISDLPVELEAKSFDEAARTFYKKISKYAEIAVRDTETTRYYERKIHNIFSEYVLVSGVMNETRRIVL